MSQAFVKEEDSEWLHEVKPTITSLMQYLRRENNGKHIFQQNITKDENGKEVYAMSNGLSYFLNIDNNWEILL